MDERPLLACSLNTNTHHLIQNISHTQMVNWIHGVVAANFPFAVSTLVPRYPDVTQPLWRFDAAMLMLR